MNKDKLALISTSKEETKIMEISRIFEVRTIFMDDGF